MKPVDFAYERPRDLDEASRLLADESVAAKIVAGGQSLGPMLNLRLAQVELLVDIAGIPELSAVSDEGESMVLGAGITHAAFEDRRCPDPTGGVLSAVAEGIAYRAVRNRGTIGGSVAHADPAADWVTTLSALGAEVLVCGSGGERSASIPTLMLGAYSIDLAPDEIIRGFRLRKLSAAARWGYFKFCRKRGEFAEAMAAVLVDPAAGICRAAIGAVDSTPIVIEDLRAALGTDGGPLDGAAARALALEMKPTADPIKNRMCAVALQRAIGRLDS